MKPENETVLTAFEMLIEEIDGAGDDFKSAMSRAALEGDVDFLRVGLERLDRLKHFQTSAMSLLLEWQKEFGPAETQTKQTRGKNDKPSSRGPRTSLVVRMPDGRVLKENTAADTFCKVLAEIGLDRVKAVGKTINNMPLVGTEKSQHYTQQKINGFYIMTHTSTIAKRRILEDLAQRFKLGVRVSVAMDA